MIIYKDNKKIIIFSTLLVLLIIFSAAINFSRAESERDDNEESSPDHERYQSEENINLNNAMSAPDTQGQEPAETPTDLEAESRSPLKLISPSAKAESESKKIEQSGAKATAQNITSESIARSKEAVLELKDTDEDGVPDRLDKYPGEDDFAYAIKDIDKNGIADDLEEFAN